MMENWKISKVCVYSTARVAEVTFQNTADERSHALVVRVLDVSLQDGLDVVHSRARLELAGQSFGGLSLPQ